MMVRFIKKLQVGKMHQLFLTLSLIVLTVTLSLRPNKSNAEPFSLTAIAAITAGIWINNAINYYREHKLLKKKDNIWSSKNKAATQMLLGIDDQTLTLKSIKKQLRYKRFKTLKNCQKLKRRKELVSNFISNLDEKIEINTYRYLDDKAPLSYRSCAWIDQERVCLYKKGEYFQIDYNSAKYFISPYICTDYDNKNPRLNTNLVTVLKHYNLKISQCHAKAQKYYWKEKILSQIVQKSKALIDLERMKFIDDDDKQKLLKNESDTFNEIKQNYDLSYGSYEALKEIFSPIIDESMEQYAIRKGYEGTVRSFSQSSVELFKGFLLDKLKDAVSWGTSKGIKYIRDNTATRKKCLKIIREQKFPIEAFTTNFCDKELKEYLREELQKKKTDPNTVILKMLLNAEIVKTSGSRINMTVKSFINVGFSAYLAFSAKKLTKITLTKSKGKFVPVLGNFFFGMEISDASTALGRVGWEALTKEGAKAKVSYIKSLQRMSEILSQMYLAEIKLSIDENEYNEETLSKLISRPCKKYRKNLLLDKLATAHKKLKSIFATQFNQGKNLKYTNFSDALKKTIYYKDKIYLNEIIPLIKSASKFKKYADNLSANNQTRSDLLKILNNTKQTTKELNFIKQYLIKLCANKARHLRKEEAVNEEELIRFYDSCRGDRFLYQGLGPIADLFFTAQKDMDIILLLEKKLIHDFKITSYQDWQLFKKAIKSLNKIFELFNHRHPTLNIKRAHQLKAVIEKKFTFLNLEILGANPKQEIIRLNRIIHSLVTPLKLRDRPFHRSRHSLFGTKYIQILNNLERHYLDFINIPQILQNDPVFMTSFFQYQEEFLNKSRAIPFHSLVQFKNQFNKKYLLLLSNYIIAKLKKIHYPDIYQIQSKILGLNKKIKELKDQYDENNQRYLNAYQKYLALEKNWNRKNSIFDDRQRKKIGEFKEPCPILSDFLGPESVKEYNQKAKIYRKRYQKIENNLRGKKAIYAIHALEKWWAPTQKKRNDAIKRYQKLRQQWYRRHQQHYSQWKRFSLPHPKAPQKSDFNLIKISQDLYIANQKTKKHKKDLYNEINIYKSKVAKTLSYHMQRYIIQNAKDEAFWRDIILSQKIREYMAKEKAIEKLMADTNLLAIDYQQLQQKLKTIKKMIKKLKRS